MKFNVKMLLTALTILLLVVTLRTSVFAGIDIIQQTKYKAKTISIETGKMTETAGKILALIRTIAIILGTIIIAVLGVKYMMGSVEEKAEYKKSFVPLVVGIIVIMTATSIATLLFSILRETDTDHSDDKIIVDSSTGLTMETQ